MCRIAAYLGPPVRLSALLTEPSHGLLHQSYAPREMTDGTLNADGWGVGWFAPELGPDPGVLRGTQPIWSDDNASTGTRAIASDTIVAVVRGATPGFGVAQMNTPPFAWGESLIVHNGRCWPWCGPLLRALRQQLDVEDEATLRGTSDTEVLGALWWAESRRVPGCDPAQALRKVLKVASHLAHDLGGGLSASLIIARRGELVASRFASRGPAPSLYIQSKAFGHAGSTLIASEPLDESEGWQCVPPSSLVRVDARGICVEPLR